MLRTMYGVPGPASFGRTWNCWTRNGHNPPSSTAQSTSRPSPIAGQRPGPPPHVDEEQHRTDERDEDQDRLRGQQRVDVGVRRAGEQVAVVEQQPVPVHPVRDGLEQDEQPDEHRQVGLGGGRRPSRRRCLQPDTAVDVVRNGRGDQSEYRPRRTRSSARTATTGSRRRRTRGRARTARRRCRSRVRCATAGTSPTDLRHCRPP